MNGLQITLSGRQVGERDDRDELCLLTVPAAARIQTASALDTDVKLVPLMRLI
jgi:hypothetical protein